MIRSLIVLVAATTLCVVFAGDALAQQRPRDTTLMDELIGGSRPYREAVARMLRKEEPKIVGGKVAPAGAYPWQVSLGISWAADPYRAHFCGGSVYSMTWIVTAAHCVEDTSPKDVIVSAGTNVLGKGGARRNVKRIIVKSDYNSGTMDNDVALIELIDPLVLGENVKAVQLVGPADEPTGVIPKAPVTVVGWGATVEGGEKVRDLRYVEVPVLDRTTCNRPLVYDNAITDNMLCAGVLAGGQDSCQGDSGGPLTINTTVDPRLAGIVSWGEGCARPNRPGVYTRVAKYTAWIEKCVVAPNECK
jgi:secreted trypsin-like serine protease